MSLVSWRTDGAITRLTLNRPEALNALSEELAAEFAAAVKRVAREKSAVASNFPPARRRWTSAAGMWPI